MVHQLYRQNVHILISKPKVWHLSVDIGTFWKVFVGTSKCDGYLRYGQMKCRVCQNQVGDLRDCLLDQTRYCTNCDERYHEGKLTFFILHKRSVVACPEATPREIEPFLKHKGKTEYTRPRFLPLRSKRPPPSPSERSSSAANMGSVSSTPEISRGAPHKVEMEIPELDLLEVEAYENTVRENQTEAQRQFLTDPFQTPRSDLRIPIQEDELVLEIPTPRKRSLECNGSTGQDGETESIKLNRALNTIKDIHHEKTRRDKRLKWSREKLREKLTASQRSNSELEQKLQVQNAQHAVLETDPRELEEAVPMRDMCIEERDARIRKMQIARQSFGVFFENDGLREEEGSP